MKAEPRYTILFNIFFQKSTDTTKFRIIFERKYTAKFDVGIHTHSYTFIRWMEYVYEFQYKIFCCVWQFSVFWLLGANVSNNPKVKFSKTSLTSTTVQSFNWIATAIISSKIVQYLPVNIVKRDKIVKTLLHCMKSSTQLIWILYRKGQIIDPA